MENNGGSDDNTNKDNKITKETLKPVTKAGSRLDKELQDWEVESTKGGGDLSE